MNCCCEKPFVIGCFNACSSINTGLIADQDGEYKILLMFNGIELECSIALLIGEEIALETEYLNEFYQYNFSIIRPDGTLFTYSDGIDEYECFQFTTRSVVVC